MYQQSSTLVIPNHTEKPNHIAIIMDGNGRWAKQRMMPRNLGHIYGTRAVRRAVKYCLKHQIPYLTLFAFSSENWRRPKDEVSLLMNLFIRSLKREVQKLKAHGVRLKVVGKLSDFSQELQREIHYAETETACNDKLVLTICANYGGRWDILEAIKKMMNEYPNLAAEELHESHLSAHLSMSWAPEPDLLIRTGGESRLSNFLIWQLAYTELYFTDKYWPEMNDQEFDKACQWYAQRERRFGRTSDQLKG
ncbi:polyprenyl diphosphate synthase [Basilea psittacipulmonis]|uniref:Isoprenyl transferase n=1 Tax=Basilea psittacipulmonis DSM 24701 TaxID=1072685 RepID=A0A077DHL3_9BURK|nr:polyprenyl diphosphate synthase [Basilea psittacipulmonis]AIL32633.1 UDP diphosphate synthase [Basilea psittacipulmonis DSM 24701]